MQNLGAKTKKTFKYKKLLQEQPLISKAMIYVRTDQTFANFLLKSILGFVSGLSLSCLLFMFFVFQLSLSLKFSVFMSSVIGVMLSLGLAFSYRIRCLVLLLIPQLFSRVGRYTLTCYALVLILTGPATNTLKNLEVLSESMACSQEQLKTSVKQMRDASRKPFYSMRDTIKRMIHKILDISKKIRRNMRKVQRLTMSVVGTLKSSQDWLKAVETSNRDLGTPYQRCVKAINDGFFHRRATISPSSPQDVTYIADVVCTPVFSSHMSLKKLSSAVNNTVVDLVDKHLQNFSEQLSTILHVTVKLHRTCDTNYNISRSASQVAAGIVTEIRGKADPMFKWLSWSSCVTSLFLLLIICRGKYYQHMYDTRICFDNRYITKEFLALDSEMAAEGKPTVLPLNNREQAKYISTTSYDLIRSEKRNLARSVIFMVITTFKLSIHIVADYSLYWVLTTIRHHERFQSQSKHPYVGVRIWGQSPLVDILKSISNVLTDSVETPAAIPLSCLPNPHHPDGQRYTQIGVLIFMIWFFALLEPYGLRLRHRVMGLYRPERSKARVAWLHDYILKSRSSFLKLTRRKLHRDFKYSAHGEKPLRDWVKTYIRCRTLRRIIGFGENTPKCLLCSAEQKQTEPAVTLKCCLTADCVGIYCEKCFQDLKEFCPICSCPIDYGDISDVSVENDSSNNEDTNHSSKNTKQSKLSNKSSKQISLKRNKLSNVRASQDNRSRTQLPNNNVIDKRKELDNIQSITNTISNKSSNKNVDTQENEFEETFDNERAFKHNDSYELIRNVLKICHRRRKIRYNLLGIHFCKKRITKPCLFLKRLKRRRNKMYRSNNMLGKKKPYSLANYYNKLRKRRPRFNSLKSRCKYLRMGNQFSKRRDLKQVYDSKACICRAKNMHKIHGKASRLYEKFINVITKPFMYYWKNSDDTTEMYDFYCGGETGRCYDYVDKYNMYVESTEGTQLLESNEENIKINESSFMSEIQNSTNWSCTPKQTNSENTISDSKSQQNLAATATSEHSEDRNINDNVTSSKDVSDTNKSSTPASTKSKKTWKSFQWFRSKKNKCLTQSSCNSNTTSSFEKKIQNLVSKGTEPSIEECSKSNSAKETYRTYNVSSPVDMRQNTSSRDKIEKDNKSNKSNNPTNSSLNEIVIEQDENFFNDLTMTSGETKTTVHLSNSVVQDYEDSRKRSKEISLPLLSSQKERISSISSDWWTPLE